MLYEGECVLEAYELVYQALQKMNISFDIAEHPPVFTTEEADAYIEGMEGVRTKSLLLSNRRDTAFYLVIMDDRKRLDMKKFAELTSEKRLHFSSPENLMEKIGLLPGAVSLFGLLNNHDRDVRIFLDRDVLIEGVITFLANDHTKTVCIAIEDMLRFIKELGYQYSVADL